jgi:hypothetical protein
MVPSCRQRQDTHINMPNIRQEHAVDVTRKRSYKCRRLMLLAIASRQLEHVVHFIAQKTQSFLLATCAASSMSRLHL